MATKIILEDSFPYTSELVGIAPDGVTPIYDRAIGSASYREIWKTFFSDGIGDTEKDFALTLAGGFGISIGRGRYFADGVTGVVNRDTGLQVEAPPVDAERVDRIVIQNNYIDRYTYMFIKKGDTELIRNDEIYELGLYDIRVRVNAAEIQAGDITDLRSNRAYCGQMMTSDASGLVPVVEGLTEDIAVLKGKVPKKLIAAFTSSGTFNPANYNLLSNELDVVIVGGGDGGDGGDGGYQSGIRGGTGGESSAFGFTSSTANYVSNFGALNKQNPYNNTSYGNGGVNGTSGSTGVVGSRGGNGGNGGNGSGTGVGNSGAGTVGGTASTTPTGSYYVGGSGGNGGDGAPNTGSGGGGGGGGGGTTYTSTSVPAGSGRSGGSGGKGRWLFITTLISSIMTYPVVIGAGGVGGSGAPSNNNTSAGNIAAAGGKGGDGGSGIVLIYGVVDSDSIFTTTWTTANQYLVIVPAFIAETNRFKIRFHAANTSATVYLNVNGGGNARLYVGASGTTNPTVGQIAANSVHLVEYSGGVYRILT